jgi:hypothetical protein
VECSKHSKAVSITLLTVPSLELQAAGVLAQIEKNNKKRQGVEVYI